jgi:hypothetical protein
MEEVLTVLGNSDSIKETETVLTLENGEFYTEKFIQRLGFVVASATPGRIKDESRVSCNGPNL